MSAPTSRRVTAILAAPRAHWAADGFLVHRYIWRSPELLRAASPFLLVDHHAPFLYPPTTFVRGVPYHPHRGIETVTLVFAGAVTHRDRAGGGGTIGPGDVQWTTAGSGIFHHECHEANFARAGGTLHMLQLWINLPAAQKMISPRERHFAASAIPSVVLAGDGGVVRVIAGTFAGVCGPADPHVPLELFDVRLNHGARLPIEIEATHNVMLLVVSGRIRINAEHAAEHAAEYVADSGAFVRFQRERGSIELEALAGATHVVVFGGAPIEEPLVRDGPFVMNDDTEIRQAYADFKEMRVRLPERSDV